jgi:hypothetical protein
MQPYILTRREQKGKMLRILEKMHVGSETNCEEGSGSGYRSEKIHSGSTTLIFMNFQWKTMTFAL